MSPSNANAKRQSSISQFFSSSPVERIASSPSKRKLSAYSHSPSKQFKPSGTESKVEHAPTNESERPKTMSRSCPQDEVVQRRTKLSGYKAGTKLTPLEQQFKDLKRANTDKILAIQVGYKFKFFGKDAVVASQLLNIMLIPGNVDLDDRTYDRYAYCSIPDNRLHIHLQRLLNHGLKVGVVKQTESAAIKSVEAGNKSALFQRSITAVYTRATYMGDESPTSDLGASDKDDHQQGERFILCINDSNSSKETSFVAVSPSTGDILYDVFADSFSRDELETRLMYINPSEVIVISETESIDKELSVLLKLHNASIKIETTTAKTPQSIQDELFEFFSSFGSKTSLEHLNEFYLLNFPLSVLACVNQLVRYLSEFNLSNIFTITTNIKPFSDSRKFMLLPANTLKALDIFHIADNPTIRRGSLMWLLDHTQTRKGARLLRNWVSKPLVQKPEIIQRQEAVAALSCGKFSHILDAFKNCISKSGKSGVDLDKVLIKVHYSAVYKSGKISRKDLFLMLKSFYDIIQVFRNFSESGVTEFTSQFPDCELLKKLIQNMIEASADSTIDNFLSQINSSAALTDNNVTDFFEYRNHKKFQIILDEFENIAIVERSLAEELDEIRKFLKRPQLQYVSNLKDTHLIEVRNGKMVDSLPSDWLKISGTKSVSRFRTPKIRELHKKLLYHKEMLQRNCDACFNLFLEEIDLKYEYLKQLVHNLAQFDCLLSLAKAVIDIGHPNCVRPTLVDYQTVDIKSGLHPVLSKLPQNVSSYVPNDICLRYDSTKVAIVTGPNMGGKSSLVKQIALFVIMTQVGCFLPCSQASMGIFDRILIRMGASDNILRGKSTFMVEMQECANIVKSYSKNSLVILDEIGRGTGTNDGIALAYSILKYIIEDKNGPLTLFITHFPSLHVLQKEYSIVKTYHMGFIEKSVDENSQDWPEVIFLYKLMDGVVSNSYGLNVAKLAGIDKKIIDKAFLASESMKQSIEKSEMLNSLLTLSPDNVFELLFATASSLCK